MKQLKTENRPKTPPPLPAPLKIKLIYLNSFKCFLNFIFCFSCFFSSAHVNESKVFDFNNFFNCAMGLKVFLDNLLGYAVGYGRYVQRFDLSENSVVYWND